MNLEFLFDLKGFRLLPRSPEITNISPKRKVSTGPFNSFAPARSYDPLITLLMSYGGNDPTHRRIPQTSYTWQGFKGIRVYFPYSEKEWRKGSQKVFKGKNSSFSWYSEDSMSRRVETVNMVSVVEPEITRVNC